jgi:ribonuclease Z
MRKIFIVSAAIMLSLAAPHIAKAAPCLIVTVTGAQGGPQAYQGQAGPGTLIRYGDDANNCSAVRLQFDAGRGTLLRLSQLNVLSSQVNAIFFTHMHNDHSEGFIDLLMHR